MVARDDSSYSYAVLSVVALVALIGLVIILDTANIELGFDRVGYAFSSLPTDGTLDHNGQTFPIILISESDAELPNLAITQEDISFDVGTETVRLTAGQTALLGNTAVTYLRTDGSNARILAEAKDAVCGPRDGQTPACRGEASCCGGTCTELTTCTGAPDGPVEACGDRQLYCCGGQRSLVACGGST
ncbi:MAG: hypothetical protein OXR66_07750 [Candidatus Woesearchaeota archaeon]|nr:hypothetical protein [Candidatus Woesearchaeota archaeon]